MLASVAFTVQGEGEDELPETVLGCCQIHRVNLDTPDFIPSS